jgi:hypothetical protein
MTNPMIAGISNIVPRSEDLARIRSSVRATPRGPPRRRTRSPGRRSSLSRRRSRINTRGSTCNTPAPGPQKPRSLARGEH